MKRKRIIAILIEAVLCIQMVAYPANAHSLSQKNILTQEAIEENPYNGAYFVGSESIGWCINEDCHIGATSFSYRFSNNVPTNIRTIVNNGAALWSPTVNIGYNENGSGFVLMISEKTSTVAAITVGDSDVDSSTGHLSGWLMSINYYHITDFDASVAAHEFGHVIGLTDLFHDENNAKLMYAYAPSPATGPTSTDIWGAKVITGQHVTHTWLYDYYGLSSTGYHQHFRDCTQCGGIGIKENCSIVMLGGLLVCEKCNAYL